MNYATHVLSSSTWTAKKFRFNASAKRSHLTRTRRPILVVIAIADFSSVGLFEWSVGPSSF